MTNKLVEDVYNYIKEYIPQKITTNLIYKIKNTIHRIVKFILTDGINNIDCLDDTLKYMYFNTTNDYVYIEIHNHYKVFRKIIDFFDKQEYKNNTYSFLDVFCELVYENYDEFLRKVNTLDDTNKFLLYGYYNKDVCSSRHWYYMANNKCAYYEIAYIDYTRNFYYDNNMQTAIKYARLAAEHGNSRALYLLAKIYDYLYKNTDDLKLQKLYDKFKWIYMKKAASKGWLAALDELFYLYREKHETKKMDDIYAVIKYYGEYSLFRYDSTDDEYDKSIHRAYPNILFLIVCTRRKFPPHLHLPPELYQQIIHDEFIKCDWKEPIPLAEV